MVNSTPSDICIHVTRISNQNIEISPINSSKNSTASTASSRTVSFPESALSKLAWLTTGAEVLELPVRQQAVRHPENNIFENLHKNTTRKVGEAPLYEVAPPRTKIDTPVKNSVSISPVQTKRKAWAFGKKSTAIAAH